MRVQVRTIVVVALAAWLGTSAYGASDKPSAASATHSPELSSPAQYPDQGLLSNYRYSNAYFGFSVDLPADAGLRPVPTPIPADGSIPLLETLGRVPEKGVLAISAYKAEEKPGQARLRLRRELDNELAIGVEELHALSKTNIGNQQFFWFETRRGIDQHAMYATELNGFVIRIFTAARDPKLLQQLQSAVIHMRFFPPAAIGQYAGVGAESYNGPTIPYRVLEELRTNPPARQLEAGTVTGNIYQNHQLGFAYELPKGWYVRSQAAVMPAVERSREQNVGEPAIGHNQKLIRDACERTLVSVWQTIPQPESGDISYEDFGEVTLFATPLACFPNVKFPDLLTDKEPLRDFLVAYGESHPIVRDMKGARAFTRDGHTFIVMDGVVAYQVAGDALSRRVSVALALTRQRDYLLAFFFAAPHDSELRELANAKISFDPEPALKQAKIATPASGDPQRPLPGGSALPSAAGSSESVAGGIPPNPGPAPPAVPDAASPAAAASATAAPASSRPTLLKPGETMEDQRMQGAPVSRKSH